MKQISGKIMRAATLKMADIVVTGLIALALGELFSWWVGAVTFLIGLVIVLRQKKEFLLPSYDKEGKESGKWHEEWHDAMRRWQIGPYK